MPHRRRAGVIGLPLDDDLDASDARDGGNDPNIEPPGLEHRPLLDVQFQKGPDVRALGTRKPRRVAADFDDSLPQTEFALGTAQPAIRQHARHAAAADAGDAEDRHFLGEKVNDLQIMVELDAIVRQRPRHFERGRDASDAIETAAIGHRVGMGAEHDGAERRLAPLAPADQISGGVDPGFKPGRPKTPVEKCAAFEEQRRKGAPRIGPIRLGYAGETVDDPGDPAGIDRQVGWDFVMGRLDHYASCSASVGNGRTNCPTPGSASTSRPSKASLPRRYVADTRQGSLIPL
ncbi:hypothetical protein D9M68_441800 [compost metagenome]